MQHYVILNVAGRFCADAAALYPEDALRTYVEKWPDGPTERVEFLVLKLGEDPSVARLAVTPTPSYTIEKAQDAGGIKVGTRVRGTDPDMIHYQQTGRVTRPYGSTTVGRAWWIKWDRDTSIETWTYESHLEAI